MDIISNVVVVTASTGNTGPIVLGNAFSSDFVTEVQAGAIDGRLYTVRIQEGANWMRVRGAYTASNRSIAVDKVLQSMIDNSVGATRMTLSGSAVVTFTPDADDWWSFRDHRSVAGTTDTIAGSDGGNLIAYNSASAIAVTIADASNSGNFPKGWRCYVKNIGAGTVTVTPTTSTVEGASSFALKSNQAAMIYSTGTSYRVLVYRNDFGTAAVRADTDFIRNDAVQSFTTDKKALALQNIGAAQNNLINGKIVESHTSNAATFAIKTLAGADPSASDPVLVIFGDGTQRALTSALSVTQASGTSMGTVSNVSFRLWFAIFDDAGTLRMASRNCSDVNGGIGGFGGGGVGSTVNDNTAVRKSWANGAVLTNAQYRLIGFADYDGGLATWNASPSRIQLAGPDTKKPGDVVQEVIAPITTAFTSSSTSFVNTTVTASLTPTSRQNPVKWRSVTPAANQGGSNSGLWSILNWSGVGDIGPTHLSYNSASSSLSADNYFDSVHEWTKLFDTTSTVTLVVKMKGDSGSGSNRYPQSGVGASPWAVATMTEYMG